MSVSRDNQACQHDDIDRSSWRLASPKLLQSRTALRNDDHSRRSKIEATPKPPIALLESLSFMGNNTGFR
eukprot:3608425-Pleurochrysis_carterae.AAC.4